MTSPGPLSALEDRVLDTIDTLTASTGTAPTSGQVARALGYAAGNSINRPLKALAEAGLIERPRQGRRGGLHRAPVAPPRRVDGAAGAELDHLRQMADRAAAVATSRAAHHQRAAAGHSADVLAWAVAEIEHLRRQSARPVTSDRSGRPAETEVAS